MWRLTKTSEFMSIFEPPALKGMVFSSLVDATEYVQPGLTKTIFPLDVWRDEQSHTLVRLNPIIVQLYEKTRLFRQSKMEKKSVRNDSPSPPPPPPSPKRRRQVKKKKIPKLPLKFVDSGTSQVPVANKSNKISTMFNTSTISTSDSEIDDNDIEMEEEEEKKETVTTLPLHDWSESMLHQYFGRPQRRNPSFPNGKDPELKTITKLKRYGPDMEYKFFCCFSHPQTKRDVWQWVIYTDLISNNSYRAQLAAIDFDIEEARNLFLVDDDDSGNCSDGVGEFEDFCKDDDKSIDKKLDVRRRDALRKRRLDNKYREITVSQWQQARSQARTNFLPMDQSG